MSEDAWRRKRKKSYQIRESRIGGDRTEGIEGKERKKPEEMETREEIGMNEDALRNKREEEILEEERAKQTEKEQSDLKVGTKETREEIGINENVWRR